MGSGKKGKKKKEVSSTVNMNIWAKCGRKGTRSIRRCQGLWMLSNLYVPICVKTIKRIDKIVQQASTSSYCIKKKLEEIQITMRIRGYNSSFVWLLFYQIIEVWLAIFNVTPLRKTVIQASSSSVKILVHSTLHRKMHSFYAKCQYNRTSILINNIQT